MKVEESNHLFSSDLATMLNTLFCLRNKFVSEVIYTKKDLSATNAQIDSFLKSSKTFLWCMHHRISCNRYTKQNVLQCANRYYSGQCS